MPEYVMPVEDTKRFGQLTEFVQGYIEAALFCGVERAENDPLKDSDKRYDASFDEIDNGTLAEMVGDCNRFQSDRNVIPLLAEAVEREGYSLEQAGRDFWFTRNGHGVGFWDRKELEEDGLGQALSDLVGIWTAYPEYNLWTDENGYIYGSEG